MQRPQDGERGDGGAGEFGRDVLGDGGEPQDADVEHLPGIKYRFEILATEVPRPRSTLLRVTALPTTSACRSI